MAQTTGATLSTSKLGKTEIVGSNLGFGCMSLSKGYYGENVDESETEKVLRHALDSGVTLINTADFYTSHVSGETSLNIKLIGRVLKDYQRDKITIVMKWGPWMEAGYQPCDLGPDGCKQRVENALKLLGTDYIDVLVWRKVGQGPPDTELSLIAKGMKAMLDAGKVKAVGLSEVSADDFKAINAVVPVSAVELEWSLFSRQNEKDLIPLVRKNGGFVLAYSPLGRGLLTGKFDLSTVEATDCRNHHSRYSEASSSINSKHIALVADLAKKKGCTPGQLALAWVLAQGSDVIPIPGTKRIKYLDENLAAVNVKLTPEEVQELRDLIPEDAVAGVR